MSRKVANSDEIGPCGGTSLAGVCSDSARGLVCQKEKKKEKKKKKKGSERRLNIPTFAPECAQIQSSDQQPCCFLLHATVASNSWLKSTQSLANRVRTRREGPGGKEPQKTKKTQQQSVRGTPAHALRRWDTTPYRDVADGARGPKQSNKQYEPVNGAWHACARTPAMGHHPIPGRGRRRTRPETNEQTVRASNHPVRIEDPRHTENPEPNPKVESRNLVRDNWPFQGKEEEQNENKRGALKLREAQTGGLDRGGKFRRAGGGGLSAGCP